MTGDPGIGVFRPGRPGIRKVLGDLEAEIMELIWANPPERGTTVRDVFKDLYGRRWTAYTTAIPRRFQRFDRITRSRDGPETIGPHWYRSCSC